MGKNDKKIIDEATDTYDTIEWLIHHTHSNERVGTWGISYEGFYATMTASCNHPALKAVSPQAPVTDWFRGRRPPSQWCVYPPANHQFSSPCLEGRNMGKA